MTKIRGSLIAMIYQKMLSLKSNENESPAMTLMGTDVERIVETWHLLLIGVWSNLIQLGIGIWLLEQKLGAVCITPVIVAFGKIPTNHRGSSDEDILTTRSGNQSFDENCNIHGSTTKDLVGSY